MKHLLMLFVLSLSPLAWSQAPADLLATKLAGMETLKSRFNQRISDEDGELLQQAEGRMVVKRPQKLFWETTDPYQHQVVTDGETLWIYDIDLEQASVQNYDSNVDKAPALLLSGDTASIVADYDVTVSAGNGAEHFLLIPKSQGSVFQQLTIGFSGDTLTVMEMQDQFGQRTAIEFRDVALNPVVDDQLFQLQLPPGVDLLEDDS